MIIYKIIRLKRTKEKCQEKYYIKNRKTNYQCIKQGIYKIIYNNDDNDNNKYKIYLCQEHYINIYHGIKRGYIKYIKRS